MATKPLTTPEIWASNALYTTGPFIGSASKVVPPGATAAEGHRPGNLFPTPAEYENSQQNELTTWVVDWLYLGTANPDADAHIVECDATGRAGVHGLDVINGVDEIAVVITAASTFAPAFLLTNTAGGAGVQVAIGAASASCFVAGTGAGVAATGYNVTMTGTPAGGAGVLVTANGATAGPGMRVTHSGTGSAAIFTGNSGAPAVTAVAAGSQSGFQGTGAGSGPGVFAISSATAGAPALVASTNNNTGAAVSATTPGGATTAASAVLATASGSAAGLRAIAAAYYAAIFTGDTTSPVFPAANFSPSDVRASSQTSGDLGFVTGEDNFVMGSGLDGTGRGVWSSTGGSAIGYTASSGAIQNVVSTAGVVVWVTAATALSENGNAPKLAGREAILRFRCTPRNAFLVAFINTLELRLLQDGAVLPGSTRSGAGAGNTAGFSLPEFSTVWQGAVVYDFRFTVASAGDHTYTVEIKSSTGTNVICRDIAFWIDGLY